MSDRPSFDHAGHHFAAVDMFGTALWQCEHCDRLVAEMTQLSWLPKCPGKPEGAT